MDNEQKSYKSLAGKVLVPMQAFGLGDVIFCQTLAKLWREEGYKIVWYVNPEFVEGLNRAYPEIAFVDIRHTRINYNVKKEFEYFGARVIPLRWSDQICKVPFKDCMKSKYQMFGLDWQIWKQAAAWKRDLSRELELMKIMNADGGKFNLVNRFFRSNNSGVVDIQVDNGIKNIEMRSIPGFSLFDWGTLIETAEEVHTVSTSLIYILEMLGKPAHIYVRRPDEKDHSYYDYILSEKMYLH